MTLAPSVTLDTSSLIRFATRDDEKRSQKVKNLLKSRQKLYIPDVVFPELEYVLTKAHGLSRDKLTDFFESLVSLRNLTVNAYISNAVKLFSHSKLDMADCIIAAQSSHGSLASFDRQLLKAEGVKSYW